MKLRVLARNRLRHKATKAACRIVVLCRSHKATQNDETRKKVVASSRNLIATQSDSEKR